MNEPNKYDLLIKLLTALILLGGFFFSITRFRLEQIANREAEDRRRMEEAKTKFWENQLKLYLAACDATSTLATMDPSTPDFIQAKSQFWKLYWGNLCMVENQEVATAMVDFGSALSAEDSPNLKTLSLRLAKSCRKELSDRWKVDLPELKK